jgi:aminoglycoside phosphotransferase (APT) family kinase protein
MEELPAGHSLADSLLTGTSEEASGDLASYARALATVHAWSMEHRNAFETAPGSDRQSPAEQSWWVTTGEEQRQRFLETTAELGVRTAGVDEDIDEALSILRAGDYRGFVHGDPCPDNVRIEDGSGICRLFDFELSSLGSVALDAAYLLAPFPCWCFSPLPTAVVSSAMEAYRQEMAACGVILGAGWDRSLVAAQACWLVGRAGVIRRSLDEDREWGTTTMRPRLLTWLRTFSTACTDGGTFERLHHLATDLADRLVSAWPAVVVPSYPAFAASDSAPANVPAWWRPRL